RLRVRDASPRARWDLRRPDAPRAVPAREGRRSLAGVEGDRALPRDRRPVVLQPHRRARRAERVRRGQAATPRRPRRARTSDPGRPRGRPDGALADERRHEVLPRRRLVAAGPDQRDGATRAGLYRGDLGRDPRCPARDRRAPGARLVTETRRVDKPWGHELIWALTD